MVFHHWEVQGVILLLYLFLAWSRQLKLIANFSEPTWGAVFRYLLLGIGHLNLALPENLYRMVRVLQLDLPFRHCWLLDGDRLHGSLVKYLLC